jgi:thioredoxin reductase (NADPH)
MELFREQALRFGAQVVSENILEVNFSARPFVLKTESGEIKAQTVI